MSCNTHDQDEKYVYQFKGESYEIIITDEGEYNEQRMEIILRDFLAMEKSGDWITINNRMTNGIKWGWLKKIV
jgi:hypothetical protein